jgi:YebC/PmpR family DNA-binding regulatory protein
MSGHSKWHSIRHKKAKEDAKRGKVFSKLIRELQVAAKAGGPDLENNPRLRQAVATAKAANMPNDNIERAIKKGAGGGEGQDYDEIALEGYGPAGVAILVETMTDNRNRTVAEIRHLLDRYNGKMGAAGCVSWMFQKHGLIMIDRDQADEDAVMEVALEAGADDIQDSEDLYEVTTSINDFEAVKQAFDKAGIPVAVAEISMIPQTTVALAGKEASQMLKLMDSIEDHDDVQHVYANFDISAEEMEKLSA